jgi:hypothetical protein
MAVLTVNTINRDSVNLTALLAAAGAAGDSFPNTGIEFVIIKNTNAATRTITMDVQTTVDGLAVTDKSFTLEATTGFRIFGPFSTSIYNDANSRVNLTYSTNTDVTVAVFKLGST